MNACVALAKDWRTDKYLRRLEVSDLCNHRQPEDAARVCRLSAGVHAFG